MLLPFNPFLLLSSGLFCSFILALELATLAFRQSIGELIWLFPGAPIFLKDCEEKYLRH